MNNYARIKSSYNSFVNNTIGYRLLTSNSWMAILTICGAVFFHLDKPIESLLFFGAVILVSLVFSKDLSPCLLPLLLASMSVLKMYGSTEHTYKAVIPLGIILLVLLMLRPIFYRVQWTSGKLFWAIFGVSISITLGGLGSLTFQQYFDLVPIFYVFTLGFGMLLNYIMMRNYTFNDTCHDPVKVLSRSMLFVGLLGICMVFPIVIESIIDNVAWNIQWSNNLSTFLIFALPFAFYLATKHTKFGSIYLIIGNLEYLACLFTLSRGGILFGTITYLLCVIATMILSDKWNKIVYLVITLAIITAGILTVMLKEGALEKIVALMKISANEARVGLIKIAIDNFMRSPLFGAGLAFSGEHYNPQKWALYWYHSLPFQIIGSLGLVGVVAYAYLFFMRVKVCVTKRTKFHVFCFLSMLGFTLMGLVNPGEFAPIPFGVLITAISAYAEIGNISDNGWKRAIVAKDFIENDNR